MSSFFRDHTLVVIGLLLVTSAGGVPSSHATGAPAALAAQDDPAVAAEAQTRAHAVIGMVDTGINPYHEAFRLDTPEAQHHPSTYLEGYPEAAVALDLTLDPDVLSGATVGGDSEDGYWEAVRRDCASVWSQVEPGILYWIPGTKILGAVFLDPLLDEWDCDGPHPDARAILDESGHGTMVASRAVADDYGACPTCKLLMVHQRGTAMVKNPRDYEDAAESLWLAQHAAWIDVQSNSWGPLAPLIVPTPVPQQHFAATPGMMRNVEEASRAHLAFWGSGNGAAFRFGAVGHPTQASFHLTPSAIIVGGHDSGYVNTWPGFPPHLVSDSCASWAAYHRDSAAAAEDAGSGTSASTPFVAGGAAGVLLEARRILGDTGSSGVDGGVVANGTPPDDVTEGPLADGVLTLAEWKEIVFKTATARPVAQYEDGPPCGLSYAPYNEVPLKWTDVPEAYPAYLHLGYGAVDDGSRTLATEVLLGKARVPERSDEDRFFAADKTYRETVYDLLTRVP